MNPQTRNNLIVLAVIGVIALVVGGGFGIWYLNRTMAVAPFNKNLAEYGTVYTTQAGTQPGQPGAGYVVGKIVTIDMKPTKAVDWIYFDLPNDLKAKKPEEVGTVVQLNWSEEKIDEYTDGAGAYVHHCQVSVVDLAKKATVATMSFRGGEPPMEKSSSGSAYGSKPTSDIVNYLKNLPKR